MDPSTAETCAPPSTLLSLSSPPSTLLFPLHSFPLLLLPPEPVVLVASYLDLPSTLHLSSTCPTFLLHLTSPTQWRLFLKKVGPLNREMVGALATFLTTTTTTTTTMVQEVVEHICTSSPPDRNSHGRVDRITLSSTSSTSSTSLNTSPAGVLLLHQLWMAGVHLGARVVKVQLEGVSTSR